MTTMTRPSTDASRTHLLPDRVTSVPVEHPFGIPGCTNGPTSREGVAFLASDDALWGFDRERVDPPENYFRVVVRYILGNTPYVHVEPVRPCPADRIGYMDGGNTVDLTGVPDLVHTLCHGFDVERETLRAVRVHDRSESPAQYDALSR